MWRQSVENVCQGREHAHQGDNGRRDKTLLLPKKKIITELKSQQPWTTVSALLGFINMAQPTDELWVEYLFYWFLLRLHKYKPQASDKIRQDLERNLKCNHLHFKFRN